MKYTVWVVSRFGSMEWKTEVPFFMGDSLGDGKLCLTHQHGFLIIDTKSQTKKFHKIGCDYEIRKTSCIGRKLLIFYCIYRKEKEVLRMWNSASNQPIMTNVELGKAHEPEKLPKKRRNPRLEDFYVTVGKNGFTLLLLKK